MRTTGLWSPAGLFPGATSTDRILGCFGCNRAAIAVAIDEIRRRDVPGSAQTDRLVAVPPASRVGADSVPPVSEDADDPTPDPTPDVAADVASAATDSSSIDLVAIEADLDGVQAALTRLADGTYWTDESTGEAIPAEVLAADPLARRA